MHTIRLVICCTSLIGTCFSGITRGDPDDVVAEVVYERSIVALVLDSNTPRLAVCIGWPEKEPSYAPASFEIHLTNRDSLSKSSLLMRFPGHRITALSFAENGTALVLGVNDRTFHYWPLDESDDNWTIKTSRWSDELQVSVCTVERDVIYIGTQASHKDRGYGGDVRAFSLAGNLLFATDELTSTSQVFATSPNSPLLAAADHNGDVNLIEQRGQRAVLSRLVVNGRPVTDVSFSDDGNVLVVGAWNGFAVHDVTALKQIADHTEKGRKYHLCRAMVKSRVGNANANSYEFLTLSAADDGTEPLCQLWELRNGDLLMAKSQRIPEFSHAVITPNWQNLLLSRGRELLRVPVQK